MPITQLANSLVTDERNKTFIFENEGHTLGSALVAVINTYQDVGFCAYTVPHPSETKFHMRIQMRSGRAIDALRRGLQDLESVCDDTLKLFNEEVHAYKARVGF